MRAELIILRAADDAALAAEMRRVAAYLDRAPGSSLLDVALTCAQTKGPAAIGVVTETVADLRARFLSAADRVAGGQHARLRDKSGTYWFRSRLLGGETGGRLAFAYPGAISFYPDMLRDLALVHGGCRSAFDELEEALAGVVDFAPANFVFPPAPCYRHDADIFSSGAYAQSTVATFAASVALSRLAEEVGLKADGVVGFGGGELAATLRAGYAGTVVPRADRIRAIREIYDIVNKAVDHAGLPKTVMFSTLLRHEGEADAAIAGFPPGKVLLALDLSPRLKTYAVAEDFADTALAALAAIGVRTVRLDLDRPFNTNLCKGLVPAVRKFADHWIRKDPVCAGYSCATAEPLPSRLRKVREDVAGRWATPVRFRETIRRMYDDGYRVFVEVGPRGFVTTAIDDTLKDVDHAAIALNSIHRSSILQAQHACAQLAALGADVDIAPMLLRRGAKALDFDAAVPPPSRRETEMRLSRVFPRLTLVADAAPFAAGMVAEPTGRGAKAALRTAAVQARERRGRQFDNGAVHPLVSDADILEQTPGVSLELRKTFVVSEIPFVGDFAIGTSQLSYTDPNLRGLLLMPMPVAAEVMGEVAEMLVPGREVVAVENFKNVRLRAFEKDRLTVLVRAERVASGDPERAAVRVQMRDDSPSSAWTWPMMEATVVLGRDRGEAVPMKVEPLSRPRSVHWAGRDVYPQRLCFGKRLRKITFVEAWSESGLDFEIEMPPLAGNVAFTPFPLWTVSPLLFGVATSGYTLWRSHERFAGAYSFPFRLRKLELHGPLPKEGAPLKCYLRLTGVTPTSHLCDITVTDGNGMAVMTFSGWEERSEHVNEGYRDVVMQPATAFITRELDAKCFGERAGEVTSAVMTDVPYSFFDRDEGIWLRTFSHVILAAAERTRFDDMPGTAARRTEWLFGRIAAKEAVRRYLRDRYQARWSYADVVLYYDHFGRPFAVGGWSDFLPGKMDIAIAHTAQFVVAVAGVNVRLGIDVESVARNLTEEFCNGVFDADEKVLAAAAGGSHRALTRFWCAKEAVSKALGVGIRYSPKEMKVAGYDADTGHLTMRLTGEWDAAFPKLRGRDLAVTVSVVRDHAVAFCSLAHTLFASE